MRPTAEGTVRLEKVKEMRAKIAAKTAGLAYQVDRAIDIMIDNLFGLHNDDARGYHEGDNCDHKKAA